ncbi:MAG: universal stress protein [Pirellulaceae bacterium]
MPLCCLVGGTAQSHQYKHVMACIDTLSEESVDDELNDKVYESALLASQYYGSNLSVVQAWRVFGEEFLLTRTSQKDFLRLLNDVQERFTKLLDTFLQKHGTSVQAKNVHMLKGSTDYILPTFINEHNVDLVVMGTVAQEVRQDG